jgi:serine/threonine protein kinase
MLKHPNIVPLLNSFIQNDAFNFIFPCLDMDLETFLARDERFGSFVHDITLYRAIQGLASAIHSVHNFRIRGEVDIDLIMYHHDLRPANILVGPDTFLLADFGLSSTKPPEKGSKTEWKNTMGDYIAPECMNADFKSQSVGRGMDIWALGCLLVELATYMLQGTAGVEAAREARLRLVSDYWRVKNSYFWLGDAIRPEVSHHVAELQAYGNDGVSQLLDVATALLRVDTNGRLQSKDALEMTTNLTTRQVYAMAEESLGNFGDSLKNCGYAFPFALDIWMEKKKLRMWARALSLDSKQPRALLIDHRVEHSVIEHSQHILKDLDDLCETHGKQLRTLESGESKFSSSDCEPLYGTVCHEIHEKLQNLYNLLPPSTLRQLSQMSERDIIRTTDTQGFSSGDVDGLTSSDNQELASMALLRNLKDALEDLSLNDAETMSLRLEDSQLSGSSKVADGYHEIAWLQKQSSSATETSLSYRVLVERADFSRSWVKRTPEERAERIAALAKLLTRKKPAHLRVLNCLGYLAPNHEGYGLIFSFPPNQENAIPETLLGHLNQSVAKHGVKRATNKPALEARCQLALALARSIAELHSIHWLHKALNSNNILFFSSPAQFGIPDLSKPFIVDFRFSRPDGLSPFTDLSRDHPFADYVHPQYLEERKWYQGKRPTDTWTGMDDRNVGRFRQLYDYYSLGIILLELAYWTPIKTILKDHKTADPKEIPGILLKKYIPRLSGLIGRLYMEATKACIDGSINEWDDSFLGPESDDFYSKVIEPLAGIYVG